MSKRTKAISGKPLGFKSMFMLMISLFACTSDPKTTVKEDTPETNIDSDGDGFYASDDCDDTDPQVNPQATEICNGIDNDCDEGVDEDVLNTYYIDSDGDGYGNLEDSTTACTPPDGYVPVGNDCDDTDPEKYPGSTQLCDDLKSTFCAGGGAISSSNFKGSFCFSPADTVPAPQSSGAAHTWQPGPITTISQ